MKENKTKAILFIIISSIFFALMGVMVKAAGDIPVFEKVFFRNIVIIILIFLINRTIVRTNLKGKRENRKTLILRSIFGVIGLVTFFYALDKLFLADATILNKLSPFFVTLFAGYYLKEKMTKFKIGICLVAFTGAILIIKPSFSFAVIPAVIGFISGMSSGAAYTVVRYLKNKENLLTIIFYFSLISIIVTTPLTFLNFRMPSGLEWFYLLMIGVLAAGGQIFLTLGYKMWEASEISVYLYTHVLFSTLFGFVIWREIPDIYSIFGSILIIGSAVINFYHKSEAAVETGR